MKLINSLKEDKDDIILSNVELNRFILHPLIQSPGSF